MAQLRNEGRNDITTRASRQTGAFSFVRNASGGIIATAKGSDSPKARALSFLAKSGALIGMKDAERDALSRGVAPLDGSDLQIRREEKDQIGYNHVRFEQFYQGLKVFATEVTVHMTKEGITSVNGAFVPNISLSTVPAIKGEEAAEAALVTLRKASSDFEGARPTKTELAIYPVGLLEGRPVVSRLAYMVEVTGQEKAEQVWIDAQTRDVLMRIPMNKTVLNRTIYSPQYLPDNPDLFVQRREGDPPHPTPFVNNLYDFAGQTYNFYSSAFGRDSYDGLGKHMISVYLVNQQCPNAYWNGQSTNYCPAFDADDVVSHEWSHAYTEYTHGLIYAFQSGALNESYSDIFGESVDLINNSDGIGGSNNAQPYPDGQRWLLGEDLGQEVQELLLRDMYDPDRLGDPGSVSSVNYACGTEDGGGVHTNSGVPNHAYALIVDGTQYAPGGMVNGQSFNGIGLTKAAAIYFRAESQHQNPNTGFAEHEEALKTSCTELIGQPLKTPSTTSATGAPAPEVISASDCQVVAKAMLAVEMSNIPPCAYGPLLNPNTPPVCIGSTTIFSEDWENGGESGAIARGWVTAGMGFGTGLVDWEDATKTAVRLFHVVSTLPAGHTGSAAFAANPKVGELGGGTCMPGGDYSGSHTLTSPNIVIPAGATAPQLMFEHYIASEAGVDGGQLEVSRNGGSYTLLPQSAYIFNAPNVPYNQASPLGNNTGPNPGEFAWTGTNLGTAILGSWGTTVVNLSSVAQPGDSIKIRFTWSQDGCNGVQGWYIDNIRVFNCPILQAPVLSVGADYQNPDPDGSFTLSWTRPVGATGPDLLQVSKTSCAPIIADNAEAGTGNWVIAKFGTTAPNWQSSPAGTKPNYNSTTFAAKPTIEAGAGNTTLTYKDPITIPVGGTTKLSFKEFYFNETGDSGKVEVSTDNGATWTAVYTNTRDMGSLPNDGATAFTSESLVGQELDLTIYSGKTIRLRFNYTQGGTDYFLFVTYGWYIDDIALINDNWANVASTAGTSFQDFKGAGTYCYRVRSTYVFGTDVLEGPFSNIVNLTVANTVTPVVSRKVHGGTHDIPLPLVGPAGVECRQGGGANADTHNVVFQFAQPATFTSASVTPGNGGTAHMAGTSTSGNEVTVTLDQVSNGQTLMVNLFGVIDGGAPRDITVPMGVLLGDVNGNGAVTNGDVALVKAQVGNSVTDENFKDDVNANGIISNGDVSLTKSRVAQ